MSRCKGIALGSGNENVSRCRCQWRELDYFKTRLSFVIKMVDEMDMFGFELLQNLYDNQILKKEDALILFIHWCFIKNGFRCLSLGDTKAYDTSEKGSELLPKEWNTRPNYALRYIKDKKLYIFHGTRSDEDLLLNLLKVDDQTVSNVQFPINQTINDLHGSLESIIPSYQNVLQTIRTKLIESVLPGNTAETSSQTEERASTTEPAPLRLGVPYGPSSGTDCPHPENDPRNIGEADLNPLAQGGGGMIYDPFSPARRNPFNPLRPALGVPGRLPPGAVPPHARFDPFGPPDIDRPRPRHNPDNDHLPPPGYDDMFM
ncbi:proteasome inhibitor 31 kDa isoform X2 [Ptiloglossa arizonensis]|uniref:proteasome inhibitor 31 kDa isoform X2 n=1 Tax=Ptiloglossa arizonensis TaxID=3350558 RepID=UPI003F9FE0F7